MCIFMHMQKSLSYAKRKLSYANIQTTTVFNIYQPKFLFNFINKCIVGNRNSISASSKAVTNILPLFP